jgi:hypothetical protein
MNRSRGSSLGFEQASPGTFLAQDALANGPQHPSRGLIAANLSPIGQTMDAIRQRLLAD